MRSKYTSKSLAEIISKMMKDQKLESRLEQLDVIDVWNELIDNSLKKYIIDSNVKGGVLNIKLNSAALRNEISYQKTDIIKKINEKIGKNIITDLKLKYLPPHFVSLA